MELVLIKTAANARISPVADKSCWCLLDKADDGQSHETFYLIKLEGGKNLSYMSTERIWSAGKEWMAHLMFSFHHSGEPSISIRFGKTVSQAPAQHGPMRWRTVSCAMVAIGLISALIVVWCHRGLHQLAYRLRLYNQNCTIGPSLPLLLWVRRAHMA